MADKVEYGIRYEMTPKAGGGIIMSQVRFPTRKEARKTAKDILQERDGSRIKTVTIIEYRESEIETL